MAIQAWLVRKRHVLSLLDGLNDAYELHTKVEHVPNVKE